MAASDISILAAGAEALPLTYTIPALQAFQVKAASASFDGTGASGTFTPVLTIRNDAGLVVARCLDSSQTTIAGGSVEPSWFPHVARHAAAATGSGLPWAFYEDFTGPTVASGAGLATISLNPTGNTFDTSDASIFGVVLSGGNYLLNLKAAGIYYVTAWVQMDFAGAATAGSGGTLQMTGANHTVGGAQDAAWISDPAAGGRSKCTPSFAGIWNLDASSTPPPITSALQAAQNGGATTTATIVALLAVQLNPTGSPNF